MGEPIPSPPSDDDLDSLRQIQAEVEAFIGSLGHPVVLEDDVELFDLTVANWRLELEYGKLIFQAWNTERSVVRRVERIAYCDQSRIAIVARKQGGRLACTLEFRELGWVDRRDRAPSPVDRRQFHLELVQMLGDEFPGWRLERLSHRSDREYSFSAWYTRGWARQSRTAWAFLGLSEGEGLGAADSVLAFGLIWLEWLRGRSDRVMVPGLKLFLPHHAVEATAHRAAYLDARIVDVEIFEWNPRRSQLVAPSVPRAGFEGEDSSSPEASKQPESLRPSDSPKRIDLRDYGNVETRLVPRRQREAVAGRHRETVRALAGDLASRVDMVPDARGAWLSLRVLGLEVARIEGETTPRVTFGLEGNERKIEEADRAEFREFLERVIRIRRAGSEGPAHELYRSQGERWLESLLIRDLTKIDPALSPDHVYPQVPAFSGSASFAMHRGVIDILGVALSERSGAPNRLAVIELKLYEEINLPLQGLDYWLRVKWLHERGQFKQFGYFPGIDLSPEPPLLYLVSPAFRFHSTTDRLIRCLAPNVEIIQVGINDQWRDGVKVLFRRVLKRGP
jgi:hypothetical protein